MRWWVWDDACPTIPAAVPPESDPVWEARYDNELERGKRTTRTLRPDGVRDLADSLACLRSLGEWGARLGYPVAADDTLHGGGLHVTRPGGWLHTHLDYDLHPHRPGWRRAVNLIAFLHDRWEPDWGGDLYLADPMGSPLVTIEPRPGRVVAFEVGDLSYHGVLPTKPDAGERVSLAVYLLSRATSSNTRRRAMYLPRRSS